MPFLARCRLAVSSSPLTRYSSMRSLPSSALLLQGQFALAALDVVFQHAVQRRGLLLDALGAVAGAVEGVHGLGDGRKALAAQGGAAQIRKGHHVHRLAGFGKEQRRGDLALRFREGAGDGGGQRRPCPVPAWCASSLPAARKASSRAVCTERPLMEAAMALWRGGRSPPAGRGRCLPQARRRAFCRGRAGARSAGRAALRARRTCSPSPAARIRGCALPRPRG